MGSETSARGKVKKVRVEDERERQLRILLDEWDDKGNSGNDAQSENDSDEESNLRKMEKKMSKKQKAKRDKAVLSILDKAGTQFPDDEHSASSGSGSGTDSEDSKKHKCRSRKVKSGAKVKKRPVIRTELWPHTIANKNEGEDNSCENILFQLFLQCFPYILVTCGDKAEVDGCAILLHAITSIMKSVSWTEAQMFHNLTLTKIEQGKLDWSADFTELSKQFVDKKVRQNLKSRSSTATSGS